MANLEICFPVTDRTACDLHRLGFHWVRRESDALDYSKLTYRERMAAGLDEYDEYDLPCHEWDVWENDQGVRAIVWLDDRDTIDLVVERVGRSSVTKEELHRADSLTFTFDYETATEQRDEA